MISTTFMHFNEMLTRNRREAEQIILDDKSYSTEESKRYGIEVTMLLMSEQLRNYLKTHATEKFKERFLTD